MSDKYLDPCFLGPYGENDDLFEKLLLELIRDHIYWRRNFHPEDPPVISTLAARQPHYEAFAADLRRELHRLTASLKRSVPFFSPRYMGHMVSDLLLPGLIAQMVTLPYNPNNVVDEAAPVTVDLELEAGLQLARMVGYPTDESRPDVAFGYLTSGGTVANFQALKTLLAMKLFPLAVRAGCERAGFELQWQDAALAEHDDWSLLNLSIPDVVALAGALNDALEATTDRARSVVMAAVSAERYEHLGLVGFFARHPGAVPVVLVPVTAHYSWEKAVKLLGLGTASLDVIPEQGMRMDIQALDDHLQRLATARKPVLAVIGILGTTEFGTLDPIAELVDARERWSRQGLGFGVHVDAAWGGYLATLFRNPDGTLREHHAVTEQFRYFPSRRVYDSIEALAHTDSITIDPHKLGYLPFGTGAYLCRDHRMMDFVAQDAAYVFESRTAGDSYRDRFRALGRFIFEGSKPGAAAAAVCLTHRVLPLDHDRFGRIPAATIRAAEYFWDRIRGLGAALAEQVVLTVPFEPDSNLICVAVNPRGNRDVGAMNRFVGALFEHLRVDRTRPLQVKEFFGSTTRLYPQALGQRDTERILAELDLDPATLVDHPTSPQQDDSLLILRHTLMNPWLADELNDINYVDRYCEYLGRIIAETLAAAPASRIDSSQKNP